MMNKNMKWVIINKEEGKEAQKIEDHLKIMTESPHQKILTKEKILQIIIEIKMNLKEINLAVGTIHKEEVYKMEVLKELLNKISPRIKKIIIIEVIISKIITIEIKMVFKATEQVKEILYLDRIKKMKTMKKLTVMTKIEFSLRDNPILHPININREIRIKDKIEEISILSNLKSAIVMIRILYLRKKEVMDKNMIMIIKVEIMEPEE